MTVKFQPICFDSMGVKSTCTFVETPDISMVIDPGVAIMHSSFPASGDEKLKWLEDSKIKIKKICKKADFVTISHYHHDHYFSDDLELYRGKTVFVKNPNNYINSKQRIRGEEFLKSVIKEFSISQDNLIFKKDNSSFSNPMKALPIANSKDFGSYNNRRNELIKKGIKKFEKMTSIWRNYQQLPEIKSDDIKIIFPKGNTFNFNNTKIRFTQPLFHGIEFAVVGWVFATIVEYKKIKILHSSDISGPIIEDYAKMIMDEDPTYLFIDGPTTYLLGYILNKINLNRTIENMVKIVENINAEVIIYDHHLTREKKFRERTKKVWDTAKEYDKYIITAAEYTGEKPVVETL